MSLVDRRTAVALLVASTLFMEILDATIITTAIPMIAQDFRVPAAHLSVGISAYLVAVTIFIPISGWAADRFGARKIYTLAIVIFMAASVLCALSTSLYTFAASRAAQGIGGAMMVPVGRLLVLRDLPKQQMVRTMAIITWPALGAPLLGPILGGWIATHFSWHWIFLINIPLGFIALGFAFALLPKTRSADPQPFDKKGFILSGTGFGLLMAGLELLSSRPANVSLPITLALAGLLLLVVAVWHLKTAANPLFSLRALSAHTFRFTIYGGSLVRVALSSTPFLIPLFLQVGLGFSAIDTGTLLIWLFTGNLLIKPATTYLMNRFGFRCVLVANGILIAASYGMVASFNSQTPVWWIAAVLFFCGITRSMHLTALNTISFADVPQSQMRDANTFSVVVMQMNRGLGITVGAIALAFGTWLQGISAATPSVGAFQIAMWTVAGIALLSVSSSVMLPKNSGSAVLNPR